MQHNEIQHLLSYSPSVKLLRAKTAPLIISFLFKAFKAKNIITIPAYELTNQLAEYVEILEDQQLLLLEGKDTLKTASHSALRERAENQFDTRRAAISRTSA